MVKSTLAILALSLSLTACDRAPSNVYTLQTTDCGQTWKTIKTGERIPSTATVLCGYNTVIPNFPMQGDLEFKAQFDKNVLVSVRISYDYEIVEPSLYLSEAKFLGKQSSSAADAAAKTNTGAFETAENQVIDKRIREAMTSRTVAMNIVTFNPAKFEDELFDASNKLLKERGVKLNSMTMVLIPEEQTRTAIDMATAVNVYRSNGMEELGQRIAVARAGATKIVIGKEKE